jgi:hypothetical protein
MTPDAGAPVVCVEGAAALAGVVIGAWLVEVVVNGMLEVFWLPQAVKNNMLKRIDKFFIYINCIINEPFCPP